MQNHISPEIRFSEELFQFILSKVSGTADSDSIINVTKPSREFIVGTLASNKAGPSESENASEKEESRSSIRARRLKVSFLIKKGLKLNKKILIKCNGFLFYSINRDLKEDNSIIMKNDNPKTGKFWKRIPFSYEFETSLSSDEPDERVIDFQHTIEAIKNDDQSSIKEIDDIWDARVSIERENYDDNTEIITINFTNNSIEPFKTENSKTNTKENQFERTLFDCKLHVDLNGVKTIPFIDTYDYNGFTQKYYSDFRTINCQAEMDDQSKSSFTTRHFTKYYQENIVPRQTIDDTDLDFFNLSKQNNAINLLKTLSSKLNDYLRVYHENFPNELNNLDEFQPQRGPHQQTWREKQNLITSYGNLLQRFGEGIYELENNSNAMQCFLHMNEAFHNYYANKGIPNGKWRLFQLVFLITTLPSITKKSHSSIADVLHVNTGGGKSEAYFALVIFALFYERLTGKVTGVTAIVKFPLRMLSIQQLERISSIISHAEKIRKQNAELYKGDDFSLGYFVGESEDFPITYSDNRKKLYDNNNNLIIPPPKSIILERCPLCDPHNRGIIRLFDDETSKRLVHQCERCNEKFYIYSSDREIFRWRPDVIVSTVDKWASLSSQRRVRNLLGGKGSMCSAGHGFIPSGDKCEDNRAEAEVFKCNNIGEDVDSVDGPILSIQDEMHLLSEEFGTIAAHFEGFIQAFVDYTSQKQIKEIALSATLNGVDHQIRELYEKDTFVIPGRCPEGEGSNIDPFFSKLDGPKRIIFGLKPNLRDNHYASLRTILHHAEFILNKQIELNRNPEAFMSHFGLKNKQEAQNLINQFLIPLTYHINKQDANDMEGYQKTVVEDGIHRSSVDNNIRRKVKLLGQPLTGDYSLTDLKERINDVKKYISEFDPHLDENNEIILRPIYATSVISHGVDLEELNFMVFQGLPYSTSEYIQSLSRVGRKKLGMVILWFYPNRVRDSSFYRNFNRYHETLDHQVKPIPISRYSKLGLYQTINSLFCAGIINYLSNKSSTPLYLKKHIKLDDTTKADLSSYIRKCYTGLDGGPLNIDIDKEIVTRIEYIQESKAQDNEFFPDVLANSGKYFYKNQTGMRGIQKDFVLLLDYNEDKFTKSRISKRD